MPIIDVGECFTIRAPLYVLKWECERERENVDIRRERGRSNTSCSPKFWCPNHIERLRTARCVFNTPTRDLSLSLSGSCLPTYFSLSHTVRVLSDSHVCIVMQMIPSHSYGSTLNLFLPPVSLLLAKSFPVCGRHTGPSLDFQTKKSQHTDFTSTFKTVCDEYFLPTFSVTRLGENCAGLAIFYSLGYILNNLSI